MEPALDLEMTVGVDIVSLARSRAQRKSCRRRHLTGGARKDGVDLGSTPEERSDCGDHLWRERSCKHIRAALPRVGNERVVRALGDVVERLRTTREVAA